MKLQDLIQEVTQSILAVLVVIGAFLIAFYQLTHAGKIELPDVIVAVLFSVVGVYFGRVVAQNGARQAGTAAAQLAVNEANANATAASKSA